MRRKYLPPITKCSVCGRSLYGVDRYHVKLIVKEGPLKGVVFKKLYLCKDCLNTLKKDKEIRKKFKIKYYKMHRLKWYL
jgi:ribosomal protein L34E